MYCVCIYDVLYYVLDMYFTHPRCQNTLIIRRSDIGHVSGRIFTYSREYMYCTCIMLYLVLYLVLYYVVCIGRVFNTCVLDVFCMYYACIVTVLGWRIHDACIGVLGWARGSVSNVMSVPDPPKRGTFQDLPRHE